jgi:hypothetical protein
MKIALLAVLFFPAIEKLTATTLASKIIDSIFS